MLPPSLRGRVATSLALAALALPSSSFAITIDIGDGAVTGALNSTVTLGAAWRMQGRDQDLIGKANLNPDVCYGHQSCQGVFRDQIEPAQTLVHAPGQFSVNNDDGDLNYDKHHLVQAVAKLTQDVTLSWHDFGLFARWMYFYDAENNDFTEYHPNRITSGNYQNVGIGPNDRSFVNTADPVTSQVLRAVYFPGQRIYGPGGVVRNKRTDGQTLQQIGTNFQMLDAVLSGKFPLPGDHTLTVKIGRQTVSWGESTLLVINSLNQANPVNANNLYRVGYQLEEVFTPVNMAFASFEPFTNATIQGFYQFEWEPLQTPTPGSYFSFIDVGTDNVGKTVSVSFGGNAEDPESYGHPQENPLALITPTTLTIERLPDHNARNSGQYGVNFSYYFENLGNGTQMGLYFMNYHSKLPYASFYATHASCARREGNSMGIDATNSLQWLLVCNDMPLNRELTLGDQRQRAARHREAAARVSGRHQALRLGVQHDDRRFLVPGRSRLSPALAAAGRHRRPRVRRVRPDAHALPRAEPGLQRIERRLDRHRWPHARQQQFRRRRGQQSVSRYVRRRRADHRAARHPGAHPSRQSAERAGARPHSRLGTRVPEFHHPVSRRADRRERAVLRAR